MENDSATIELSTPYTNRNLQPKLKTHQVREATRKHRSISTASRISVSEVQVVTTEDGQNA